jgi:hypothetical protein
MKRKFDFRVVVRTIFVCAFFVLLFIGQSVTAREIAGVDVPSTITMDNEILVLNGAGIRQKLFIKVYVGALYLKAKRTTVNDVLNDPGAKRIVMSFLYKEVSTKKLVTGWNKGFTGNNTPEELKILQDRINQFNALFTTVRKGDVIQLDYKSAEGTQVWINETLKGTVPGEDFFRAVLKIWLGPKPAEEDLKDALLGNSY